MSSELERMLRESRESLPSPDDQATARARGGVLAPFRRRRARTRAVVLVGAAAAVVLGVSAGSLNAPTGTAAHEPATLGFVPEPGWSALQSPPAAVLGEPSVAVASNVPIDPDDAVHGLADPSGLPYSTLLALPPSGIVLVAFVTPPLPRHVAVPANPPYERTGLPLRLRDAVPFSYWTAPVRPDEPLAQYQLRAHVEGVDVDVAIYFGTSSPSSASRAAAQRQLEHLVIRSRPQMAGTSRTPSSAAAPGPPIASTLDQTYTCTTTIRGGLYLIESRAQAGQRVDGRWSKLPYAVIGSGAETVSQRSAPTTSLAWISAGAPTAATTLDDTWLAFSATSGGTLGVSRTMCRRSTAHVELSPRGLRGGAVQAQSRSFACGVGRKVHLRVRATALSRISLRERARIFNATNATIQRAEIEVVTPSGRPLVYSSVDQSGKTRQFTARGCTLES